MPKPHHDRFGFRLRGVPWTQIAPGCREKACLSNGRQFRIVEFSERFQELEWCLNGHTGYVLEGEIIVNVNGDLLSYRKGDVIDLPQGTRHRHDSTVKSATLFLVDSADQSPSIQQS